MEISSNRVQFGVRIGASRLLVLPGGVRAECDSSGRKGAQYREKAGEVVDADSRLGVLGDQGGKRSFAIGRTRGPDSARGDTAEVGEPLAGGRREVGAGGDAPSI